jgi:hypothetical protein
MAKARTTLLPTKGWDRRLQHILQAKLSDFKYCVQCPAVRVGLRNSCVTRSWHGESEHMKSECVLPGCRTILLRSAQRATYLAVSSWAWATPAPANKGMQQQIPTSVTRANTHRSSPCMYKQIKRSHLPERTWPQGQRRGSVPLLRHK